MIKLARSVVDECVSTHLADVAQRAHRAVQAGHQSSAQYGVQVRRAVLGDSPALISPSLHGSGVCEDVQRSRDAASPLDVDGVLTSLKGHLCVLVHYTRHACSPHTLGRRRVAQQALHHYDVELNRDPSLDTAVRQPSALLPVV
jgi:hypothetical protein